MDEVWFGIVAIATFILGLTLGISASESSWEKDCATLGKHRSDEKVYFCFPEGGK